MKAKVHSFETFGTVDGPGTRFVVFLKGCNLRCLYCHNPDTWDSDGADMYSVDEILKKFESVKEFESGITISGGEPLLQIDFLIELFKETKRLGIHTCLDTSGSTFKVSEHSKFNELIKNVDLILLDIKHIDNDKHIELVGKTNVNILAFAKYLSDNKIPMWVRHVVVPDYTLNDVYLFQLGKFLKTLDNVEGLEVLPYHLMGTAKYEQLRMTYPLEGLRSATKEEAIRAKKIILLGMRS